MVLQAMASVVGKISQVGGHGARPSVAKVCLVGVVKVLYVIFFSNFNHCINLNHSLCNKYLQTVIVARTLTCQNKLQRLYCVVRTHYLKRPERKLLDAIS